MVRASAPASSLVTSRSALNNSFIPVSESGPKQEEESEETPPPKEETKPPEPPSRNRSTGTAQARAAAAKNSSNCAPRVSALPAVVHNWESSLVVHIERFKRYPAEASARGEKGIVQVAFTVDHEGWVSFKHVVRSSGSTILDQEALAMLDRAQPLPRPPDRITTSELSFVIPVRFNIR
jgi:protein TonB